MSYTRHTWTDPETITAAKLNNIEDGIEEAAQSGGGGGYDLVIDYDLSSRVCTIVSGNILDCEDKVDNGELVNAIAVIRNVYSYIPSGKNTNKIGIYLPLLSLSGAEALLQFGGIWTSISYVSSLGLQVYYDPATGNISSCEYADHTIWED